MNTLDQRILIPAAPDMVWSYISDLSKNPTWQADCRSLSFLTSLRSGPGTRWRYTSASGRDYVVEITAWYDRLGYEYTLVDGVPYHENRGRIRLQEIPEGTIVQWTFNYDLGGVLGGLRNSLGIKRQIESIMADSLRALYRAISQSQSGQRLHEAKSLMRDAPDVEARSHYKPRHPSAASREETMSEGPQPPIAIPEPPVSLEDTRPRRPVSVSAAESRPLTEPDFLSDMPDEATAQGEKVVSVSEPVSASTPPPLDEARFMPPPPEQAAVTQRREEVFPLPEEPEVSPLATEHIPKAPSVESAETVEPARPARATASPEDVSKMDTAQISVFEVFGLPKPSETQEMRAIASQEAIKSAVEAAAAPEDTQPTVTVQKIIKSEHFGRIGQRILLRRRRVKLRRPE